jgi:import inner membrane translocase subunit TIM21
MSCWIIFLLLIEHCPLYPQEKTDLTTTEDPFDAPTYNIPEKPVTFAEGASYSVVILAGLGVAAMAGYAVFKELIFEPKEYVLHSFN